jgi:hypothetical protein
VRRLLSTVILIAVANCTTPLLRAQESNPERVTVTWSDPSRPGQLKVDLFNGSITVKTHNRPDVIIEAKPAADGNPTARGNIGNRGARDNRGARGDGGPTEAATAGLKRIGGTTTAGVTIEESNNVMSISSSPFPAQCCTSYEILVPAKTNLNLTSLTGGPITVEGVEGEIEATNMNGPLNFNNIAGSVVANSMNGKVTASLRQVAANKMMSFASMNGDIDVTLPPNTKANLQMHTNLGEIYSDFDVQLRPAPRPTPQDNRKQGGNFKVEFDNVTNGVINGGGPEFDLRTFHGTIYIRKGK